jgi:hypothetical protein
MLLLVLLLVLPAAVNLGTELQSHGGVLCHCCWQPVYLLSPVTAAAAARLLPLLLCTQ